MGKAEGKVSEKIPGHWSSVLKGRERDQAPGTGRRALRAEQKARAGEGGALPCRALWPGDSPELWVSIRAWQGGGAAGSVVRCVSHKATRVARASHWGGCSAPLHHVRHQSRGLAG